MNRVQEITSEIPMYTSRRCRASYGILCREKYDPRRHAGEDVSVDEYDKKKWVDGQIHWVVKKVKEGKYHNTPRASPLLLPVQENEIERTP